MKTSVTSSKTAASLFAFLAIAALPAIAHAQDSADVLFKEGRALLDQKKYDEACPKLAESQRIEPGAGTLVALALCHEGQGKTATAHRELEDAATTASIKGRDDLSNAAKKRANAMEPKLSKLVVRAESDVVLRCDGEGVKANEPFAVDPGEHKIEAFGKGRVPRSYTVRLANAGLTEIVVEHLDGEKDAAPTAKPALSLVTNESPFGDRPGQPPPAADSSSPSTGTAQRIIGLGIVAAGAAGLGTGGYFGVKAMHDASDARKLEGQEATDKHDSSKKNFTTAVVSVAAGTGALALGLILFATAPKAPSTTARIVPTGGPGDVGMGMAATF